MGIALIVSFIAHLLGDFTLQNHQMANLKSKNSLVCAVHVLIYSSLFLVLMGSFAEVSWPALLVIATTHYLIDRHKLADRWARIYGVGYQDNLLEPAFPGPLLDDPPEHMKDWLVVIVDQSFHLAINTAALLFLWDYSPVSITLQSICS